MQSPLTFAVVGVIGSGALARGVVQLAAQAGSLVQLFDTRPETGSAARDALVAHWAQQQALCQLSAEAAAACGSRLQQVQALSQLSGCDLVIEATEESLEARAQWVAELERAVPAATVLATSTTSLPVGAIAAALQQPQRLAGLHFLQPVPQVKLVEVVAALQTDPEVCDRLARYVKQLGQTPVRSADMPGFIVNHAARAYCTEALRIASEGVADVQTIDRILKDQVGFALGPFELLDQIGLDDAHEEMEALYHQHHQEPRYRPSTLAAQRVASGLLGAQSGEGFYRYVDGTPVRSAEQPVPLVEQMPPVWVSPRAVRRAELLQLLKDLGARIETGSSPSPAALTLVAPLGFDVTTVAVVERLDPARTVGIDMMVEDGATRRRVLATNPATRPDMRDAAHALFARDGKAVSVIRDSGGFVTQRVIATLVNIASDICQQRICTPADLETAVTLGLGYPMGALAIGDRLGPTNVLEVLFNLQTVYGDPRYRPSPWLRRRGAIGLSLTHEED